MLYRKAYDRLLEWKGQPKRKALCIMGARQIGKTTVIRQFGKEQYSVLYVPVTEIFFTYASVRFFEKQSLSLSAPRGSSVLFSSFVLTPVIPGNPLAVLK
mgnify:CR=1 FL=1